MKGTVLIVDDDASIRFGVKHFLAQQGWRVAEAACAEELWARLKETTPEVLILDHRLPDATALEIFPRLGAFGPPPPTIVLTGFGSIELAVQTIQAGASQFLTKPVDLAVLATVVERLAAARRAEVYEQLERERKPRLDPFLGTSRHIREVRALAERVAASDVTVLILGETGTGKGVLARWIHDHSPRAGRAFVDLNCASLGGELLSSELFGHEKGAFTGAHERKLGLVEIAHRGTLFLDEIGDLSADVQAKLLKVLEERRVRRVGGTADIPVELRLISATNRNLAAAADAGRFRLDLYYRIAALPIVLPPLRERREDIPALAQALLASLASSAAHKRELAPDALAKLQEHHWPGNIRELRNVLERAVLLSHSPVLRADDLPVLPAGPTSRRGQAETVEEAPDAPLRSLAEVEREHIERVLRAVGGHVQRAAEILGIPRSTLYQKLKRFRLKSPRTA